MEDFLKSNPPVTAAVGFGLLVLVVVMIGLAIRENARARQRRQDELSSREVAVIEEDIRATGGGVFCIVMLILTIVVSVISSFAATTIFQQIEASVSLMTGLILFGLGVALGRRRTYRIYRSESRTSA